MVPYEIKNPSGTEIRTCSDISCGRVLQIKDKDIKTHPFMRVDFLPTYNLNKVTRGRVQYVVCPYCSAIAIVGEVKAETLETPPEGTVIEGEWLNDSD